MTTAFSTAQQRYEALGQQERLLVAKTLSDLALLRCPSSDDMVAAFNRLPGDLHFLAQDCYGAWLMGLLKF